MKLLVTSVRYIQVIRTQPYLDFFEYLLQTENKHKIVNLHTTNGTAKYPFCVVWSSENEHQIMKVLIL